MAGSRRQARGLAHAWLCKRRAPAVGDAWDVPLRGRPAPLEARQFLHVCVDASQDDGLAAQVFDEAFVAPGAVPTFVFLIDCVELRAWRYQGAEVAEVVRRLKRIAANDRLEDGPSGDEGA